jgi:protein NrfC
MAGDKKATPNKGEKKKFSRRDFVVGGGTVIAGGALTAVSPAAAMAAAGKKADTKGYPLSTAYLVYDSHRCAGCYACMLACSLVHEGATSLSLSRIQMHRAVLTKYPLDIQLHVCRQCPDPLCVKNCPTGACNVSAKNGNIRMIDSKKCTGCETCIKSCPHIPHRTIWNPEVKKATKCDLCLDTPFYNKKGGPGASQACVEACPASCLKVVAELPSQTDISGYDVNLAPPPSKAKPGGFGPPGAKPKSGPPETAAPKS